jgi:hypothetical protein
MSTGTPFSDLFGDMFGKFDPSRFTGQAPQPRRCETAKELGDWFQAFGLACRAALPKAPAP